MHTLRITCFSLKALSYDFSMYSDGGTLVLMIPVIVVTKKVAV